jgi:hypothetical protein
MTMIERVARAMSVHAQTSTAGDGLAATDAWQAHCEDQADREWHHYVGFAKAAIGALRSVPDHLFLEHTDDSRGAMAHWGIMIDAILGEAVDG